MREKLIMFTAEQLVLLLISYLANTFSAFAGGGAGLIQLPVLIFLGLQFSIALGVGATSRHLRSGKVNLIFS